MRRTFVIVMSVILMLITGCTAGDLREMPSFSRDLTQEDMDDISKFRTGGTLFVGAGDRWIENSIIGNYHMFTLPPLWMNTEAVAFDYRKGIGAVTCTDIPGIHPFISKWVGIRQARGRFWGRSLVQC